MYLLTDILIRMLVSLSHLILKVGFRHAHSKYRGISRDRVRHVDKHHRFEIFLHESIERQIILK